MPAFLPSLPAFFLAVLCFTQPVTPIGVFCLMVAPFWAVNAVGITSLGWQRLPLAASAEYLPWGRLSSKLPTGASGMVWNVLEVMFVFGLMNVSPCRFRVTP